MKQGRNRLQKGFTLLELAMVLFIITLVLGSVLSPLSTRLEQSGRKSTQSQLSEIKASLLGYALINGHLPCPDCPADGANCGASGTAISNDGVEDGFDGATGVSPRVGNYTTCAVQTGNVPWATLGVSEFDAWGNRFAYSVDTEFADDIDGTTEAAPCDATPTTSGISFMLCSTGDMTLVDAAGILIAATVPATVLSYGSNGQAFGGTAPASATELDNWWTDGTDPRQFVSNAYIQATATQFDDLTIWITLPELMFRMANAELLP